MYDLCEYLRRAWEKICAYSLTHPTLIHSHTLSIHPFTVHVDLSIHQSIFVSSIYPSVVHLSSSLCFFIHGSTNLTEGRRPSKIAIAYIETDTESQKRPENTALASALPPIPSTAWSRNIFAFPATGRRIRNFGRSGHKAKEARGSA